MYTGLLSSSIQFSSVAQSCSTLCNPMDCSTPGFPVHHQLLELTQIHVHHVGDAIQPLNPLSSFSSHLQSFPASGSFQMSQFFASGGQSIGDLASASVLSMNIQDRFPLGWTGWISLQSKGLSRVFSKTTAQKHQFFSFQSTLTALLWEQAAYAHSSRADSRLPIVFLLGPQPSKQPTGSYSPLLDPGTGYVTGVTHSPGHISIYVISLSLESLPGTQVSTVPFLPTQFCIDHSYSLSCIVVFM